MKKGSRFFIGYVAMTLLLPVLLLHPTLIYYDLAGMGGYDGFASAELMLQHGSWNPRTTGTIVYYFFAAASVGWILSVVNAFLCIVMLAARSSYIFQRVE